MDVEDKLRLVLYGLFYVEDLAAFGGLTDSQKDAFRRDHSSDELRNMREGLEWGIANPDYPFSTLWAGIQFSDEEILAYIQILSRDFGDLVPDD